MFQCVVDKFSKKIPKKTQAFTHVYTNNYEECETLLNTNTINIDYVFKICSTKSDLMVDNYKRKIDNEKEDDVGILIEKYIFLRKTLIESRLKVLMHKFRKSKELRVNLLLVAIRQNNIDMVRLLIKNGANVFLKNLTENPIQVTLNEKQYDILRVLLESIPSGYFSNKKKSKMFHQDTVRILTLASTEQPIHIFQLLCQNLLEKAKLKSTGLSIVQVFEMKCEIDEIYNRIELLLSYGVSGNAEPDNYIIRALELKSLSLLKLLIKYGSNVNCVTFSNAPKNENTYHNSCYFPLIYLIRNYNEENKYEVLELLLQNEANPSFCDSNTGITPIRAAIAKKDTKYIELLLKYGADIKYLDECGSLLMRAIYNAEITKLLIDNDVGIVKNEFALNEAICLYHLEQDDYFLAVVNLLFEYYRKKNCLNMKDENGFTALSYCIYFNDKTMINRLLLNGVDVNDKIGQNANALWLAALFSTKDIFLQLLSNTKDINLKANIREIHFESGSFKEDLTTIEVAFQTRKYDIVKILKDCGASIDKILKNLKDLRSEPDEEHKELLNYLLKPLSLQSLCAINLRKYALKSKCVLDELPKCLQDRVLFKF